MFSVAARQAREAKESAEDHESDKGKPAHLRWVTEPPTPSPGLTRRVPGAQRPDAFVADRAPEPSGPAPETTPEDVYSFLSNFQSGVARGRADAATDDAPTTQEDGW
jgi:hypothetical protein